MKPGDAGDNHSTTDIESWIGTGFIRGMVAISTALPRLTRAAHSHADPRR